MQTAKLHPTNRGKALGVGGGARGNLNLSSLGKEFDGEYSEVVTQFHRFTRPLSRGRGATGAIAPENEYRVHYSLKSRLRQLKSHRGKSKILI